MIRISAEIYVDETKYEIANNNLINIDFSGQDRSDTSLPSWGIKSNSGSVEMYDADGTIAKLSREGSLANSPIKIYLNVGERKEQIGGFYVTEASQDRQTMGTKIEFQDILISWNEKQMPKYYYPYYPRNISLKDVLDTLVERSDITLKYSDDFTRIRFSRFYIPYPIIEAGSLWAQMTKICEVSSCYIYCDNEGIPTIHYGGYT